LIPLKIILEPLDKSLRQASAAVLRGMLWQHKRSRSGAAASICNAAVQRFLLHRTLAAALLAGLLGCAGSLPSSRPPSGSIPSQESDAQRLVRVRLELAVSYFQEDRPDIAEQEVQRALAVDPRSADAYALLALIQMRRQELDKADGSARRALELRPDDGDMQHNYGWLLCQQDRFDAAQQWLDKALQQPDYREQPKTWMAKGLCMQRAGDLAQAHEWLAKAHALDSNNPLYAYHLARLLLLRGQPQQAQMYARRINSGVAANAESLWLGLRIERALQDSAAMRALAQRLQLHYPDSRQWQAYQRGAFDEE